MTDFFPADYAAARDRFRREASRHGWHIESHPLGGGDLTVDVASSPGDGPGLLVLSSGLHGVEGFFGSAVQSAMLDRWGARPPVRCVFLHALNPFGFAHLRRGDADNVDGNRNFLLTGEEYSGSPPGYADLNAFLNPESPPSAWEPFTLKALWMIARHGMPKLRRAIVSGQHDFPRGLFFAGKCPSPTHALLDANLARWVGGARRVVHLDFHTGLGPFGACKLLIDYALAPAQRENLAAWFGPDSYSAVGDSAGFDARGGFGRWCVSRKFADDYLFACAEFGTYGPIHMLSRLRDENRAYFRCDAADPRRARAKRALVEAFCPASVRWREAVLRKAIDLAERAAAGLSPR